MADRIMWRRPRGAVRHVTHAFVQQACLRSIEFAHHGITCVAAELVGWEAISRAVMRIGGRPGQQGSSDDGVACKLKQSMYARGHTSSRGRFFLRCVVKGRREHTNGRAVGRGMRRRRRTPWRARLSRSPRVIWGWRRRCDVM